MPEPERGFLSARSLKALQENLRRAGPTAAAGYTLIGAILLFGILGAALDKWLDAAPWFLFGGLLLGIVVGFYELAKTIWRR
ncbi:MAG TPA: AtpZ/AtpI family protein [Vicinamibacterales bacterium]|jgi:F0F1-type ATP synthase assembly protein I|nr:AtpZ/AtpI family protein [Vicinamibacterales bacterium]